MRTLIIASVLFIFGIYGCFAQEFQGKIIYQAQREFDIEFGGTGLNKALQDKMKAKFKDLSQKKYVLTFNNEESIYREKKSLGAPSATADGIQVTHVSSNDALYHNISSKTFVSERSILGKAFLVTDSLEKPDWELVNETKKIGKYICFKAVLTEEVKVNPFFSDDKQKTEKTKLETIAVWYTPQIPVHHGPKGYWGLPGLILEVQEDGNSLLGTKVTINPEKEVVIEIPTNGKEIDEVAFKKLKQKKMKAWMERHSVKNGDGSGFSITINKG